MDIWNIFIAFIVQSIEFVTYEAGISEAIAIICVTLIGRLILMPVNIFAMANMYKNKKAMAAIKPELEKIKATHKDSPNEIAKRTMALYKKHNIKFLDKNSVMNIASQGVFGLGMFQALQQVIFNSKFAWIVNIAKPDVALALLVGVITYFSMVVMPGSAEQTSTLLFVIPAIICIITLINFPSAIGLYWATSSVTSLLQSLALNRYFHQQEAGNTI
ncbi:YidC/Oxa1 family membrane protein insertase [Colwellia sp. 4_MG-2023]|uniref:YidC/Oxa1 family membrane protein insertase n=1 Tax=unclassified Colwellia TaxID=196834 RepID=UPI0026E38633|nr:MULTISPECIES: YidC/Oxa1 family membrane protein insertase [unclassified Colwellia]MDO6507803.1 YidC/Oxa1 family membrane protein insertase [Colwellia sp. 5_MG-2023]MDO6556494.1 YidC/Oxa1 family membrane protein insertase [Colwellia sp. 4_MG-2023]